MPKYEHLHQFTTKDRYGFLLIVIVEPHFGHLAWCASLFIFFKIGNGPFSQYRRIDKVAKPGSSILLLSKMKA